MALMVNRILAIAEDGSLRIDDSQTPRRPLSNESSRDS